MAAHRSSLKHGAGGGGHHRRSSPHRTLDAEQRKRMSEERKGKPHPHKGGRRGPRHSTG